MGNCGGICKSDLLQYKGDIKIFNLFSNNNEEIDYDIDKIIFLQRKIKIFLKLIHSNKKSRKHKKFKYKSNQMEDSDTNLVNLNGINNNSVQNKLTCAKSPTFKNSSLNKNSLHNESFQKENIIPEKKQKNRNNQNNKKGRSSLLSDKINSNINNYMASGLEINEKFYKSEYKENFEFKKEKKTNNKIKKENEKDNDKVNESTKNNEEEKKKKLLKLFENKKLNNNKIEEQKSGNKEEPKEEEKKEKLKEETKEENIEQNEKNKNINSNIASLSYPNFMKKGSGNFIINIPKPKNTNTKIQNSEKDKKIEDNLDDKSKIIPEVNKFNDSQKVYNNNSLITDDKIKNEQTLDSFSMPIINQDEYQLNSLNYTQNLVETTLSPTTVLDVKIDSYNNKTNIINGNKNEKRNKQENKVKNNKKKIFGYNSNKDKKCNMKNNSLNKRRKDNIQRKKIRQAFDRNGYKGKYLDININGSINLNNGNNKKRNSKSLNKSMKIPSNSNFKDSYICENNNNLSSFNPIVEFKGMSINYSSRKRTIKKTKNENNKENKKKVKNITKTNKSSYNKNNQYNDNVDNLVQNDLVNENEDFNQNTNIENNKNDPELIDIRKHLNDFYEMKQNNPGKIFNYFSFINGNKKINLENELNKNIESNLHEYNKNLISNSNLNTYSNIQSSNNEFDNNKYNISKLSNQNDRRFLVQNKYMYEPQINKKDDNDYINKLINNHYNFDNNLINDDNYVNEMYEKQSEHLDYLDERLKNNEKNKTKLLEKL